MENTQKKNGQDQDLSIRHKIKGAVVIVSLIIVSVAVVAQFVPLLSLGRAEMEPAMNMKGMDDMAGMSMGVNETGQASAMLTPLSRERIGLRVSVVEEREAEKKIRAAGRVVYDERKLAQIHLRVEGWIGDLFVNFTGQQVKKGDPLFTVYSPDLLSSQQEYLLAKRGQKKLQASLVADVRETGDLIVSSAKERLLLWNLTEKQIRTLEQRGSAETEMTYYAPMAGVVTKRMGTKGMRVTPEMALYEIADLSTVWIVADLYESDLSYLKVGQEADVQISAYPDERFSAKVAFIDPVLNPQSRTVQVRLELPNPGLRLKPEMFAEVVFRIPLEKGLFIPESAVLDSGLRKIVFVDQNTGLGSPHSENSSAGMEMYIPREINARRMDAHYLVLSGLAAGERVVTSANFLLDAESKLMAAANMMGALGMGGIKMEQAQMGEMDMGGMNMGDMKGMPGMKMPMSSSVLTQKSGDLTLTLSSLPSPPKEGENTVRLKIADVSGLTIENAEVVFAYTMPMPGMKVAKRKAVFKDGHYEAKIPFGMAGTWEVFAQVVLPGKAGIESKFVLEVSGEMDMEGMPGM